MLSGYVCICALLDYILMLAASYTSGQLHNVFAFVIIIKDLNFNTCTCIINKTSRQRFYSWDLLINWIWFNLILHCENYLSYQREFLP